MGALSRCVALTLLLCHPANAQTLPSVDDLFARGVKAHQSGDMLGAIEAYQAALEKAPARVDIRSNLGAAFARLGRYDEAIQHYTAALETEPGQTAVRFNLAAALYKSARVQAAKAELEKVVEQEPGNRSAVLLLADCHLQMGNDAAVVALLSPREADLKSDRLFAYLMGNALLRRNELLRGQTYIDQLFRDGETAEARLLMGVAHLERRDGPAAVQELERAIALNASLPSAHSLLGRALLLAGHRDAATIAFRQELQINPNDFDSNLQLGMLLKDENKLDESYAHLTRAGRLRSNDVAVLYGLGALHLAVGRIEEAQKALELVIAQAPDYSQAHVLLATTYYRQKKRELGDRHRGIAERLTAEQQSREPGAADNPPPPPPRGNAGAAADRPADPTGPSPMPPRRETAGDPASGGKPAPAPALLSDAERKMLDLALARSKEGNPDAAFEILRGLANQGQDHPAVIEAFGLAVLRLREVPQDKRPMIQLAGRGGYHMARVRRTSLGRLAFEELVSRYPAEPNVHYAFGNYLLPEEPEAAIAEFQKELRLSPEHYPSMLQLAVAETGKGRPADALPLAEKAVQLAPDAPVGRLVLGRALLEAGQTSRAIQELEQGARLAPQNPGFFFSLARAYRGAGREADAVRAREEFLRLERENK